MNQPPIFLINLDSSCERLALSQSRLERNNLSFTRISAINGTELSEQEVKQHYCETINETKYHKTLTRGEIGCYLSHKKVWQKIIDEKIEYAIILEDDFEVVGDIHKTISTINALSTSWDYIKLATYKSKTRNIAYRRTMNDMNLVIYNKAMAGTCAQAVSYQGAKNLLANSVKFGRPVDIDLQYWWEKNIELFALLPYAFSPDLNIKSDIAAMKLKNSKVSSNFWKRKYQQLNYLYKNNKERTELILKYK